MLGGQAGASVQVGEVTLHGARANSDEFSGDRHGSTGGYEGREHFVEATGTLTLDAAGSAKSPRPASPQARSPDHPPTWAVWLLTLASWRPRVKSLEGATNI
jgi:hypothetical protein